MYQYSAFQLVLGIVIVTTYGCAAIKRDHYDAPQVIPVPVSFKQSVYTDLESNPVTYKKGPTPAYLHAKQDRLKKDLTLANLYAKQDPLIQHVADRKVPTLVDPQTKPEPLVGALLPEWWRLLSNPELNALIDRVIANNTDLHITTLRVVQAKARMEQAGAGQWPTLDVPLHIESKAPKNGIGLVSPDGKIHTLRTYQIGPRVDWRVDLWGELSALTESSWMQLLRSIYQRDDTRRQLIANTVAFYVEYLSLNDRLRVAHETEEVLRGLLSDVNKRLEVGDATIIELEQQRSAVYSVQATIPALELQREIVSNALAQLVGVTPASFTLSDFGLDSLSYPNIRLGVPVELVLRRPDVRAIEARLLSADADIDVARARLLPPLDLSVQAGYGSLILSKLFQSQNLFWNTIVEISSSIFDHGKRANEIAFSKALHEEMVETYVMTMYKAVRETEDAIATIQMIGKRVEAQQFATDAAYRVWNFSLESYNAGAVDHLVLLDSERTYHRTLDELHLLRMERMKGIVNLFSSLGGGIPQTDAVPLPSHTLAQGDNSPGNSGAQPYRQYIRHDVRNDKEYWLVELAGLHDRHDISHVWSDLNQRFPNLMHERSMLPRLQGRVATDHKEWSSWYRLYIARFDKSKDAESFCAQLVTELQRCRIVSSLELGFIDPLQPATAEIQTSPELTPEPPCQRTRKPQPTSCPTRQQMDSVQTRTLCPSFM